MIFSPSFWSIYFLLFKMNKTKKKVDSEEVLAFGIGLGWLGCKCQNYLLWTAEVGRVSDHGSCLQDNSHITFHSLSFHGLGG